MTLRMRCLSGVARTPAHRIQWRRIRPSRRYYSSDQPNYSGNLKSEANTEDSEWFETLRNEMLNRELPLERDVIHDRTLKTLEATLYSFFPRSWKASVTESRTQDRGMPGAIGEHTIFCNPALPDTSLLTDGTDGLHSPGGPFVRRMWAGGAVRVHKDLYYGNEAGWALHKHILCFERIKDVQLRGSGEKEKIFITIERNFARYDPVFDAIQAMKGRQSNTSLTKLLKEKMRNCDQVCLTEDRNIVFLRERSAKELEDIEAGIMAPVKYLQAPTEPNFFHTITPTNTLLSRFSALTFNAHLIHLDREFARNVEGHRNLLVHGPLTLTLMLKFIGTHLEALPGGAHIVQAIEYRNLAPLYCGEALRLCAKEKEGARMDDGRVYDVWIEGPTGGMAVKALVRTASRPDQKPSSARTMSKSSRKARTKNDRPHGTALIIRKVVTDLESDSVNRSSSTSSSIKHNPTSIRSVISNGRIPSDLRIIKSERAVILSSFTMPGSERFLPGYTGSTSIGSSTPSHKSTPPKTPIIADNDSNMLIRPVHVPIPMRSTMDLVNRNILQRTMRRNRSRHPRIKPLALVRYHYRNPMREITNKLANSKFQRGGVRCRFSTKPTKPTIRTFAAKWDHVDAQRVRYGKFARSGGPRKTVSDAPVKLGWARPWWRKVEDAGVKR